jgi:DNA-binding NarL/FixJ family response regulator
VFSDQLDETAKLQREALMKILIADDHPVLLEGIREMLDLDDRFEVVAAVHTGSSVLPFVSRTSPDVALLDIALPGLDGFECLILLRERFPAVRVVLLAERISATDTAKAFALGACGVIVKDILTTELAAAVYAAVSGEAYVSVDEPEPSRRDRAARTAGLTAREVEIVTAVAQGLSNREIARLLHITEPTVKFHLSNVYRRLRVSNRTEAARWALSTGLAGGEHPRGTVTAAV